MPLVSVRLSPEEYEQLKKFAKKQKMKVSEIIRWGIFYMKMAKDEKTMRELGAIRDLLTDSFKDVLSDVERRAVEKLRSKQFQNRLERELVPAMSAKLGSLTEAFERERPYKKRRGRPRLEKRRGRPLA